MDPSRANPTGGARPSGDGLVWPPLKSDPKGEPLVYDLHRNALMSVDDAAAAAMDGRGSGAGRVAAPGGGLYSDTLSAFAPESGAAQGRAQRPADSKVYGRPAASPWHRRIQWNRVLTPPVVMAALVLLVLLQAGILLSFLGRDQTSSVSNPTRNVPVAESPLPMFTATAAAAQHPAAAPAQQPAAAPAQQPAAAPAQQLAAAPAQQQVRTAAPAPAAPGPVRADTPYPAPPTPAPSAPGSAVAAPTATSGLEAPVAGRLIVRSSPDGATVTVDGRVRGTTPLTLEGLAVGNHRVLISNGGTVVEQSVAVATGSTTSLVVPLPQSGYVDVRASIDVQIFEGGRLLGMSADGPLNIGPGLHKLELRNELLGYEGEAEVMVIAGEVARLRPALPDGLLQVNALPWAHVLVDGQPVGDTPLGNLRVPLGRHEIRFHHPELGEQVRQVVVSARTPTRVSVDLR